MNLNRRLSRLLIIVSLSLLGACSSIVQGSSQTVLVTTPGVTDATCTLSSPEIGSQVVRTPSSINLEKSKHDIAVRCDKEGYEPAVGMIRSDFDATTLGNIILGGPLGLIIDAASGAGNEYQPSIAVQMAKIGEGPPQPAPVPESDTPIADTGPPPNCKDVGGYEAYLKKTGKVCML